MIATAIIAGVSAAASVAGGIAKTVSARRQQRELQRNLDRQKAENRAWYDRRYNEDQLQRSENRALLEQARKRLMQSSKAAAGTAAVMGSSNAVAAAQKEANNEAYTGLVSSVASNASARRDAVEDKYLARKNALDARQDDVTNARYAANQAAIDTAVAGVQGAANAYLAAHSPKVGDDSAQMAKMAESKGVGNVLNQGAAEQFRSSASAAPTTTNVVNEFDAANKRRLAGLMGF